METVRDLSANPCPYPVVTIGVFDGVHRGHQEILRQVAARARQMAGTAVVLTFHPHPRKVVTPGDPPRLLQTLEQRLELMKELGMDLVVRLDFTAELSLFTPERFARDILYNQGIREIHVGKNFRFGHRRAGDFETLKELGRRFGFQVFDVDAVTFRGQRISSTRIRDLLAGGRVELARRLLGRPYSIRGRVVQGAGRGAPLGFPTANLESDNELIPAPGIYVTRNWIDGQSRDSVTSIGYRPTIYRDGESQLTIESYVLDFEADLYGKRIGLDFYFRLRPELKFESLEALQDRMAQDVRRARQYWERTACRSQQTKSGR